jgi:hypothetical protein
LICFNVSLPPSKPNRFCPFEQALNLEDLDGVPVSLSIRGRTYRRACRTAKSRDLFCIASSAERPNGGIQKYILEGRQNHLEELFKHYMRTLVHTTYIVIISGQEYYSGLADNLIFHNESTFSGAPINELVNEIYEECFRDGAINKMIDFLSIRRHLIWREEFLFFITLLNSRVSQ